MAVIADQMQRGGGLAHVASAAGNVIGRMNRQLGSLGAKSAKNLLASTHARKTKNKDGTQMALAAMAAVRQKRKMDMKWRTEADRCRRSALAWAFVLGVSAIFIFYALVASLKFGQGEAAGLFASWGAAFFFTAILLEPTVICLLSALPCLATQDTRMGRCCLRVKWCWDELLSP